MKKSTSKSYEELVKGLKRHPDKVDNPYALAHYIKNKYGSDLDMVLSAARLYVKIQKIKKATVSKETDILQHKMQSEHGQLSIGQKVAAIRSNIRLANLKLLTAAEFKEEEHPRDESGEFTCKECGESMTKDKQPEHETGHAYNKLDKGEKEKILKEIFPQKGILVDRFKAEPFNNLPIKVQSEILEKLQKKENIFPDDEREMRDKPTKQIQKPSHAENMKRLEELDKKKAEDDEIVSNVTTKYTHLNSKFVREQVGKARQIQQQHNSVVNKLLGDLRQDFPDALEVSGRVKTIHNMVEKVGRKPKDYPSVDKLTDVSGLRVVTSGGIDSVKDAVAKIKKGNYNVTEEDNYIDNPKAGYRSHHFLIKDKETGAVSELQVRTKNQDTWAAYVHDKIYKMPDKAIKQLGSSITEAYEYAAHLSEYFYSLDTGKTNVQKPDCPEKIMEVIGGCLDLS